MHDLQTAEPRRHPKAFILLYSILCIGTNLIHPITPAMFQSLGYRDSMFGIAFACMSVTNFLTAPFWGVFSQKRGYVRAFSLGTAGYMVGQLLFCFARTELTTVLARACAGLFSSSFSIAGMMYITHAVEPEQRSRYVSIFIAFYTMSNAMGYLVGGLLGTIGYTVTFMAQAVFCFGVAAAARIFFPEINPDAKKGEKIDFKKVNPFSAFVEVKKVLTPALAVFFAITMISSFATTCFDNSFNYYIRDQFAFPTSYNGYIKAAVGLIGLGANLTINTWLAKKKQDRRHIIYAFASSTLFLLLLPLTDRIGLFIALAICYYTSNAVFQPIQQNLGNGGGDGVIYGAYTSMRGVGMVFGSLLAGLFYEAGPKLPFWLAAAGFLISAVMSVVNRRQYREEPLAKNNKA